MPEAEYTNTNGVRQFFGGKSKMWVNRRVRLDPQFPRPIYFGNKTPHWRIADLRAYAERCAKESAQ